MKIHNEGKKIIPVAFIIIAVLDLLIYFFTKEYLIFYFLMGASLVLAGLIVSFFRVPARLIEKNAAHILAPADGKIVEVIKAYEKEYFKDERWQVSIFMSPLNVHQNRAPVSGKIVYENHKRGAFYPAFVKKSSEKNERNSVVFKTENNVEILARQIAGTVARRIITSKKPGDSLEQGQEYGFIRFGSRVDLFLPLDAKINVQVKDESVGGKTVVATIGEI